MHPIRVPLSGPGTVVATDNGNPTDMTPFPLTTRNAFNGLALAIVRAQRGQRGRIVVTASADGLESGTCVVRL